MAEEFKQTSNKDYSNLKTFTHCVCQKGETW